MTDDKAILQGAFPALYPSPHEVADAVAEYRARQDAERTKMARLRALRLEAEARRGRPQSKSARAR